MKLLLSVIMVLGITQGAALASNQSGPGRVAVESIQINGSGCSMGYVGSDQWKDIVQARTPDYFIEVGRYSGIERKNCQAIIDILKPQGWTYRVASIEVTGWAQVRGKVIAEVSNSHYIQGQSTTNSARLDFGPKFRNNYSLLNDTKGEWAPCGVDRALNVNTSILLRTSSNDDHAYLKVNPNTRIRLNWKRC